MDSPSAGTMTAGPPDLGSPRRRRAAATALLVIVLIAALITYIRLAGPEDSAPGTAVPGATAASATSAPVVAEEQPSSQAPAAQKTRLRSPEDSAPGTAVPGATAAPATSAPVVAEEQPSSQAPAAQKTRWRPEAGLSWQWQLSVPVDQSVDAAVYDIDMFENDASVVTSLHAAGRKVICYIDVGGWEDYRPDAADFPASVKGKPIDGWPSERWLDIRQIDVLQPIMAARFDLCAQRGFDGVEPDLMDAASADTGFPLTADDQLKYNLMIADLGHERGLAVGLKNDLTQIPQLVSHFEFSVNEQCAEYSECQLLVPFIAAGKPVFHAEYDVPTTAFCQQTTLLGFSSIRKKLELGARVETC